MQSEGMNNQSIIGEHRIGIIISLGLKKTRQQKDYQIIQQSDLEYPKFIKDDNSMHIVSHQ